MVFCSHGNGYRTNNNAIKKTICSICIANYNGIGIIDSAIESVSAQDCDFEFEIIIRLFQAHLNGLVSGQRFKIKMILNLVPHSPGQRAGGHVLVYKRRPVYSLCHVARSGGE